MAEAISVSFEEDVLAAVNQECTEYGDNRSQLINEAVRNHLNLGGASD